MFQPFPPVHNSTCLPKCALVLPPALLSHHVIDPDAPPFFLSPARISLCEISVLSTFSPTSLPLPLLQAGRGQQHVYMSESSANRQPTPLSFPISSFVRSLLCPGEHRLRLYSSRRGQWLVTCRVPIFIHPSLWSPNPPPKVSVPFLDLKSSAPLPSLL
jgi:hypothetical protein